MQPVHCNVVDQGPLDVLSKEVLFQTLHALFQSLLILMGLPLKMKHFSCCACIHSSDAIVQNLQQSTPSMVEKRHGICARERTDYVHRIPTGCY